MKPLLQRAEIRRDLRAALARKSEQGEVARRRAPEEATRDRVTEEEAAREAEHQLAKKVLCELISGPGTVRGESGEEGAAVARNGRQARERRNTATVEAAQLGQIGDERTRGDGSDAGNGAKQIVGFPPQGRRANEGVEILVEAAESFLEPGDVSIEMPLQATIAQQAFPPTFTGLSLLLGRV